MDTEASSSRALIDAEHLKLLSIFHYVVAGLSALFGCIPIFHLAFGIMFLTLGDKMGAGKDAPPAFLGWFIIGMASVFILIGWTLAVLLFCAARFIAARRHYNFCFVLACVECLFAPFGTILGVFTLLVLCRPSVKPLFPRASLAPRA
jgi:hypothetical protein